jgi:hypothetical protein
MSSLRLKTILSIIQEDLEDFDGKIYFLKGRYCGGKSKCSGLFYFDAEDRPIIKIGTNGFKKTEDWAGLLIHEYCHFEQWKNNAKAWVDYDDSDISLEEILKYPEKFKDHIVKLIRLELDCEKRSVKIIKRNQLFDAGNYINNANAVLFKYVCLYHFGQWPQKSIYSKGIVRALPFKLLRSVDDYLNFDKKILRDIFQIS